MHRGDENGCEAGGCEKNQKLPCWLGAAIIPLNRDFTVESEQANYRHMEGPDYKNDDLKLHCQAPENL